MQRFLLTVGLRALFTAKPRGDIIVSSQRTVMQTFVPINSFAQSAKVMDLQRLGKQIIECQQIFKALSIPGYGWQSHPAVKMWRGHRGALLNYTTAFHNEWKMRRGKDHGGYLNLLRIAEGHFVDPSEYNMPKWWGVFEVHESHKSNLVRKFPEHYEKYFPGVRGNLEYVWPIN